MKLNDWATVSIFAVGTKENWATSSRVSVSNSKWNCEDCATESSYSVVSSKLNCEDCDTESSFSKAISKYIGNTATLSLVSL